MISSSAPRLRWRSFADVAESYHVARTEYTVRTPCPVHYHEFAELFWVDQGRGWHFINGRRVELAPGQLWFIRPDDVHGFSAPKGETLVMTNVPFLPPVVEHLRARYFPREKRAWWADTTEAAALLDKGALLKFSSAADTLAHAPRDLLYLDRFLLGVLAEVVRDTLEGNLDAMPDWLQSACRRFRRPEQFSTGVKGLFKLAGRCPEHVARVMRQTMDTTPTQYVNAVRISHAALQLRMTNKPVTQVALDAGYENLSHFFSVFRTQHGCSPGVYRGRLAAPV